MNEFRAFYSHGKKPLTKEALTNKKIVLGISVVSQKNHVSNRLAGIANLLKEFSGPTIKNYALVGDGIQRFNLSMEINGKILPDDFTFASQILGDQWIDNNPHILDNNQLIRYFNILKSPTFTKVYKTINDAIETDPSTRIAFDNSRDLYLERFKINFLKRNGNNKNIKLNEEIAKQYSLEAIKEELAVIFAIAINEKIDFFAYTDGPLEAFQACQKLFANETHIEWLRIKMKMIKKAHDASDKQSTHHSLFEHQFNESTLSEEWNVKEKMHRNELSRLQSNKPHTSNFDLEQESEDTSSTRSSSSPNSTPNQISPHNTPHKNYKYSVNDLFDHAVEKLADENAPDKKVKIAGKLLRSIMMDDNDDNLQNFNKALKANKDQGDLTHSLTHHKLNIINEQPKTYRSKSCPESYQLSKNRYGTWNTQNNFSKNNKPRSNPELPTQIQVSPVTTRSLTLSFSDTDT